ncbi:MAG: biotin/lipoyl-binding protein, partial [Flavobacteriales bacterium]
MIRTLLLLAVPALFLAACGAPDAPAGDAPNTDVDQADGNARKVTTLTLETAPFDHYFTVQGNVETDRMARLFPMTQGTVERIRVTEGETVRKGQVLLDLDNDVIASNRDELDTRLGLAQDLLARQERLWEQGI